MPISSSSENDVKIARPDASDGVDVHDLIAACPPLDTNSLYANLLQCTHFAETCATARRGGDLVGWVSGYRLPTEPDTYFLWQIAVAAGARGLGIPARLVDDVLARPACGGVRFLQATITRDNVASWKLFHGLARRFDSPLAQDVAFDRERHFNGRHDNEVLVRIGPFVDRFMQA